MNMDTHVIVKKGHLTLPQKGFLGGKSWSKKWCILEADTQSSPACFQQHDSQENLSRNPKTISLAKLSKVEKREGGFEITLHKESHVFRCEDDDLFQWIQAFESVMPSMNRMSTFSEDLIVDENILYESLDAPPMFPVKVIENEESLRCQLSTQKNYSLAINMTNIAVLETPNKVPLYQWPYEYIRSFGRTSEMFQINAGRRCPSKDGQFSFATDKAFEIYNSININTNTMRIQSCKDSSKNEMTTDTASQHTPLPNVVRPDKLQPASKPIPPLRSRSDNAIPYTPDLKKQQITQSKSLTTSQSISADDSFKERLQGIVNQTSMSDDGKPVLKSLTESDSEAETKHSKSPQQKISKMAKKELKKEREREKKERERREKEEHKRQKEEAKRNAKDKKGNKSRDKQPVPTNVEENQYDNPLNCYDEVGDVLKAVAEVQISSGYAVPADSTHEKVTPVDNHYSEPLDASTTKEAGMYSTVESNRSEAWRKFGRNQDVQHTEDYENIKSAATTFSESNYDLPEGDQATSFDDEDETYDHFDARGKQKKSQMENIYGISSAKPIEPFGVSEAASASSGYEETSTVIVKDLSGTEKEKYIVLRKDHFPEESSDF